MTYKYVPIQTHDTVILHANQGRHRAIHSYSTSHTLRNLHQHRRIRYRLSSFRRRDHREPGQVREYEEALDTGECRRRRDGV